MLAASTFDLIFPDLPHHVRDRLGRLRVPVHGVHRTGGSQAGSAGRARHGGARRAAQGRRGGDRDRRRDRDRRLDPLVRRHAALRVRRLDREPVRIVLTIGGLAATGAFFAGLIGVPPNIKRLSALGKEVAASGGPPMPEQAAEMHEVQERRRKLSLLDLALIAIAVFCMATARYW